MQVNLRYGRSHKALTLPDHIAADVIRKPAMPVILDSEASVRSAFQSPVGCLPLTAIAGDARTACIAICDITRPVPNAVFLRPLIENLVDGGISTENISILVATGLHRPNEGAELAELIGDEWVLQNIHIRNHDARSDGDHVLLGQTESRGTVVRIDRTFVEADIRIATGLVEPHFMAGYSGGRKVIAPGLAHSETITTFHSARFMNDPAATSCNFAGNPLHEEQLEIVKLLGGALAVNTVIDEDRNLSFINFGEILESHSQAVDFVRGYCEVSVPQKYHTVVTSSAGYPLDRTYYQTVKGLVCAMQILEGGGNLIIVSECSEGLGSPEFADAQRRLIEAGPEAFVKSILQKSHAAVDEWQTQMQTKPMLLGDLHLVSEGLTPDERKLIGIDHHTDLDQIVAACARRNPGQRIAVIPEGPYVIPRVAAAAVP